MFATMMEHQNQKGFVRKKFGPEICRSKFSIFFSKFLHVLPYLTSLRRKYLGNGSTYEAQLELILIAREQATNDVKRIHMRYILRDIWRQTPEGKDKDTCFQRSRQADTSSNLEFTF